MLTRAELHARFYTGTVTEKLTLARSLYAAHGEKLALLPEILAQLTLLRHKESALLKQMQTMEMGQTCSLCVSRVGGGCCSRYMAGENDVLQLLMNLLAEVPVALQRDDDSGCCFLGSRGCTLLLKPLFCLNYNCSHIKDKADSRSLLLLEQHAGSLLCQQTELEGMLLNYFAMTL